MVARGGDKGGDAMSVLLSWLIRASTLLYPLLAMVVLTRADSCKIEKTCLLY
jgi:hypothetical protein